MKILKNGIELFDWQKKAVKHCDNVFDNGYQGAALFMEMRTGKTLAAMYMAAKLYQELKIERVVVFASKTIAGVWKEHFEGCCDIDYTLAIASGSTKKKSEIIQNLARRGKGLKVLVINYEALILNASDIFKFLNDDELVKAKDKNNFILKRKRNGVPYFIHKRKNMVILDESHAIKNGQAKTTKLMLQLGILAKYKLCLTGTPRTNSDLDFFTQYKFLDNRIFGENFFRFRSMFFYATGYMNHIYKLHKNPAVQDLFHKKLATLAYVVKSKDCFDMPDMTETIIPITLESKVNKMYNELLKEMVAEIENGIITVQNALTKTIRLRQLTGGFINGIEDSEGNISEDVLKVSDAKLNALKDIIQNTKGKLIIFAEFIPEINAIDRLVTKLGYEHSVLYGATKDRDEQRANFASKDSCKIFIAQTACGSKGIDLASAQTICYYSLGYNWEVFEQSKARILGAKQKGRSVEYFYLIAHQSIDGEVLKALKNKKTKSENMLKSIKGLSKAS